MPGGYENFNYAWIYDTHIWYNGAWRLFNGVAHVSPTGAESHFGYVYMDPAHWIGIFDRKCLD